MQVNEIIQNIQSFLVVSVLLISLKNIIIYLESIF